jgi:uracil-DNA glycosylase
MNADDIKSMFEGLTDDTKKVVAKKLSAQLTEAIMEVNKDIESFVLSDYLVAVERAKTQLAIMTSTPALLQAVAAAESKLAEARKSPLVLNKMRSLISPPPSLIFNAFRHCPVSKIRVVILGQDPYIKPGEAMGLSFGVNRGVAIPPSLKNIYKCLQNHKLIRDSPTHGDLTNWAKQGVLLLNAALTVRIGKSNSHATCWSTYTDALIKELSALPHKITFILFGGFAQGKKSLIDQRRHLVFEWGHPSPLNAANQSEGPRNFINCNVFSRVNDILIANGEPVIDWNPDSTGPNSTRVGGVTGGGSAATPANEGEVQPDNTLQELTPEEAVKKDMIENNNFIASMRDGATAPREASSHSQVPVTAPQAAVKKAPTPMDETPKESWIRECSMDDPPPLTLNTLWIFTDGGSSKNGMADCKSSWAFFMTDGCIAAKLMGTVDDVEIPGQAYKSSNNRGELTAIYFALKTLWTDVQRESPRFSFQKIILVSDSEYGIKCIQLWYKNWVADPIKHKLSEKKNIDLIEPAYRLYTDLKLRFDFEIRHINSHVIAPDNEDSEEWFCWKCNSIVDELCNRALGRK